MPTASATGHSNSLSSDADRPGSRPPPLKRYKLLAQNHQSTSTITRATGINAELERYLAENVNFDSSVENGLSFWTAREQSYPLLAPLAEDLVAAPASQAYVERVFSLCGDLCARKRNRASVNLERRVFLKINRLYMKYD